MAHRTSRYTDPLHPYTRALFSAMPIPDPFVEETRERIILTGDVPNPVNPPSGCRFHPRYPLVMDVCKQTDPEFRDTRSGHYVACHAVK